MTNIRQTLSGSENGLKVISTFKSFKPLEYANYIPFIKAGK